MHSRSSTLVRSSPLSRSSIGLIAVAITGILLMCFLANYWVSKRGAVPPGRSFLLLGATLAVLLLFTLGNCTDAFLLLRASQLGVATEPGNPAKIAQLSMEFDEAKYTFGGDGHKGEKGTAAP
jgi:hypothetical protein